MDQNCNADGFVRPGKYEFIVYVILWQLFPGAHYHLKSIVKHACNSSASNALTIAGLQHCCAMLTDCAHVNNQLESKCDSVSLGLRCALCVRKHGINTNSKAMSCPQHQINQFVQKKCYPAVKKLNRFCSHTPAGWCKALPLGFKCFQCTQKLVKQRVYGWDCLKENARQSCFPRQNWTTSCNPSLLRKNLLARCGSPGASGS